MRSNIEDSEIINSKQKNVRWSTLRFELSGDMLIGSDGPIAYFLDPGGANRQVTLPGFINGRFYVISNVGSANTIEVLDGDAVSLATLSVDDTAVFVSSVSEWTIAFGGSTGPQGATGPSGTTLRSGSGAPSNGLGSDTEFYIDTTDWNIHGPKAAGVWPAGVSLVGPAGVAGATGATGPEGPAGSGRVNSVALVLPDIFNVSGSPIDVANPSGTLTGALAVQAANTVFAGRSDVGAAVAPAFRTLVAADIPTIPFTKLSGTATDAQIPTILTGHTLAGDTLIPLGKIGSDGKVGFGTATLTYPLNLDSGASGDPLAAFFAGTVADGTAVSMFLGKSAAAGGTGIFKMVPNVATPASSRIDIGIYGDDLTTQGLSILKGGNVGIGSTGLVTGAKVNVSGGSINLSVTNPTLMSTAVTFENTGETATAVDATAATFLATYTGSYGAGGPGAAVIAQTVLSSTFTGGSAPGGLYGGVVVDADGSDPYGTMGVINNGPNVTTPVGAAVWAISRRIAGAQVALFRATAENDNNTHAGCGLLITSSTALNAVSNGVIITQAVDTGLKIGGSGSVLPTAPILVTNTSDADLFRVSNGGTVSAAGIIHVKGFSIPSAGAGVEIGYTSGAGFLLAYDRGASAYKPFDFNGSQLTLSVAGGAIVTVSSSGVGIGQSTPDANYLLQLPNSGAQKAKANAWETYSDGRLKPEASRAPIENVMDIVMAMRPLLFDQYDSDNDPVSGAIRLKDTFIRTLGFIAQDEEAHAPWLVAAGSEKQTWSFNYGKASVLAIAAVQNHESRLAAIEAQLGVRN